MLTIGVQALVVLFPVNATMASCTIQNASENSTSRDVRICLTGVLLTLNIIGLLSIT